MKLSRMDEMALCGFVKNPLMSIRELADFLDVNYWTLYKSIERLKRKGVFKEVVIPDFPSLGFELLVIGYGSLTKRRMQAFEKIKSMRTRTEFSCGMFYAFSESYRGFIVGVSRNYTQIVKGLLYTEKIAHIREMLKSEDTNLLLLPFQVTKVPVFFDYSGVICKDLNVDLEALPIEKKEKTKLNRKDVAVLKELIRRPDGTITDVANALGMSKQSVSKIRKRLFQEGWIHKRVIPNMKYLGYEVLVFVHWSTDPQVMADLEGKQPEDFGFDTTNIIFAAFNPLEGAALAPFRSLKESREMVNSFQKFAENTGVIIKEPHMLFLSIQEGMDIRNHTYEGLIDLIPDGPIEPPRL